MGEFLVHLILAAWARQLRMLPSLSAFREGRAVLTDGTDWPVEYLFPEVEA